MKHIAGLIILAVLLAGCPWFKSDEMKEGEWKATSKRLGDEISKHKKAYPHIAGLLDKRWKKAEPRYKEALKIKDQARRVAAMKAALAPCDDAIHGLNSFESDREEITRLLKKHEGKLSSEQKKEYADKIAGARKALKAKPGDGELDALLKKTRQASQDWRARVQKIVFAEAAAKKAPPPPPEHPVVEPGKGVQKMVFPGVEEPLDVMLGMDVLKLAGPTGIEIGEHKTKVRGKPRKISIGNSVFGFDKLGKLAWFKIALRDLPEGIIALGASVPKHARLEDLKTLLKGCGELEPAGKSYLKLQCMEGKLLAYGKKVKLEAELFFTTSPEKYPFPEK